MNYEFKFKLQIGKAPSRLIAQVGPGSDVPKALKDNLVEIEMPDTTETPNCSELIKNVPHVDSPLLPVPKGLARCPVCKEYKGVTTLRELPNPYGLDDNEDPEKPVRVQCICDGIPCPRCKINRIHRPISNVWSERGGFGHIPYFGGMIPCNECYAKQKAEDAAEQEKRRSQRNQ